MGAVISVCKRYRYELWRDIGGSKPPVLFIMLNPSTADADKDDPTIRRCISYAKKWGHRELIVGNLFAYRSTDPKNLKIETNVAGIDNNHFLKKMAKRACLHIAAWGTRGSLYGRDDEVVELMHNEGIILHALKVTKGGHPSHPLYLSKEAVPINYR